MVNEKLRPHSLKQKQFYLDPLLHNSRVFLIVLLVSGVEFFALMLLYAGIPNFFKSSYTVSLAEAKHRIPPYVSNRGLQKQWKAPDTKSAHQANNGTKQDSVLLKFEQNLLPVPQQVSFSGQPFSLKGAWHLVLGSAITTNDPAVQSLMAGLQHRSDLKLVSAQTPTKKYALPAIQFTVKAGAVPI